MAGEYYAGRGRRSLGQGGGPPEPEVWREWFVYSADFAGAQQLGAGTANARPTALAFAAFEIRISDWNFEFQKTMYSATDPRVYVRYRDSNSGRYLQRGTLDLQAVAGIASAQNFVGVAPNPRAPTFKPFVWPRAYIIAASGELAVEAADYSGVANTVRIAFHGAQVKPGRAPWDRPIGARLPYTVALPPDSTNPAVGANATTPISASIDAEADFVIYAISGVRQGAALLTLQDDRGRAWFSAQQDIDNIIGNGGFPNILPAPRFVPRGSAISGTIQDTSGSSNIVRVYLHGERIYDA